MYLNNYACDKEPTLSRFLISQNKWKWVFCYNSLGHNSLIQPRLWRQWARSSAFCYSDLFRFPHFSTSLNFLQIWALSTDVQLASVQVSVQASARQVTFFFSAILGWEVCFESLSCGGAMAWDWDTVFWHRVVCFTPKHDVRTPNAWGSKTIPRNQSASSMFDAIIGFFFWNNLGSSFLFWQEWM